jgi:hypothetical protein
MGTRSATFKHLAEWIGIGENLRVESAVLDVASAMNPIQKHRPDIEMRQSARQQEPQVKRPNRSS